MTTVTHGGLILSSFVLDILYTLLYNINNYNYDFNMILFNININIMMLYTL